MAPGLRDPEGRDPEGRDPEAQRSAAPWRAGTVQRGTPAARREALVEARVQRRHPAARRSGTCLGLANPWQRRSNSGRSRGPASSPARPRRRAVRRRGSAAAMRRARAWCPPEAGVREASSCFRTHSRSCCRADWWCGSGRTGRLRRSCARNRSSAPKGGAKYPPSEPDPARRTCSPRCFPKAHRFPKARCHSRGSSGRARDCLARNGCSPPHEGSAPRAPSQSPQPMEASFLRGNTYAAHFRPPASEPSKAGPRATSVVVDCGARPRSPRTPSGRARIPPPRPLVSDPRYRSNP